MIAHSLRAPAHSREIGSGFLELTLPLFLHLTPSTWLPTIDQVIPDLATELEDALAFTTNVEALGPAERLWIEMVVRTVERLAEIEDALAEDGVVARGSRQQPRPHPLIAIERQLRAGVTRELEKMGLTPEARRRALRREEMRMDGALENLLAQMTGE